jgi:hypothetical protein
MNKLYILFAWATCVTGIYFEVNELIWRAIRNAGLGGHAIGAVFIIVPFGVLAFEWLVAVVVPALFIIDIARSGQHGPTKTR